MSPFSRGHFCVSPFQGQKRYPKELLRERFRRTFGVNFWCDLPSRPLFYWVEPSNYSENSFVLFVRLFWLWVSGTFLRDKQNKSMKRSHPKNVEVSHSNSFWLLVFFSQSDSSSLSSPTPELTKKTNKYRRRPPRIVSLRQYVLTMRPAEIVAFVMPKSWKV